MSTSITEEDFKKYKRVQKSGMFNMFDHRAREVAGLSKEQWMIIIKDYDKLNKAWNENDKYNKIKELIADLEWEMDRMSSSGRSTLSDLWKILKIGEKQ